MSDGTSRRASAITVPGSVLSQPESATMPSSACAIAKSSIESAMTSRDTSDARIPSVPIEMPSDTAIVLNSTGVPPASRMPALTCSASARRCTLQGVTSVHVLATPTSGFSRSASVNPAPLSIARAGARAVPFFSASLRIGFSRSS